MPIKGGTICSKHDEIMMLAGKIVNTAEQDISQGEANQIIAWAEEIVNQAEKAKDDGNRMEAGLVEKRKEIDRLTEERDGMKDEIRTAERIIEDLEEQLAEARKPEGVE